jgi:2,4-dienoyl-CoA reductase-like NADH-dependent reductase (Old Yellow Enzyme family)
MNNLEYLLRPVTVRSLEIPNRAVMPPMGTCLGNTDGTVSDANIAYLKRRAHGGAGLIISEIISVHPDGHESPTSLGGYDDRFLPGLARMAETVHVCGNKAVMQIHHAGRESMYQLERGAAMAPSPVASYIFGKKPREMSKSDIQDVVAAFGATADRAVRAGFDAVEIHGAHGYLLTQFLSGHSNRRTDEYGGGFRNRARFILEVIEEVRMRAGNAVPVMLRLSIEESIQNGYSAEDMQGIVSDFVAAGVDVIHASFGTHGSPAGITIAPAEYEPGFNAVLARKIKSVVDVPVIAVGRFTDPFLANQVIARGDADMVAFGRQHLADPDFLKNAVEGHPERTTVCLACNQGCIERLMFEGKRIRCAINPETGQELVYPSKKVRHGRSVWVIGAGPGGLTAAYEAARLGHRVTLFEKENAVGGQIRYASRAPYKSGYEEWIRALAEKAERAGVAVRLGTNVTEDMIMSRDGSADAVIIATGGVKIIPRIDGIDMPHVCNAWEILSGHIAPRNNSFIIGGGLVGMETADFMQSRGIKNVVVIEQLPVSPVPPYTSHGYMLHGRLKKAGYEILLNTKVKAIKTDSVLFVEGGRRFRDEPASQVIIATGLTSSDTLKTFMDENNITSFIVGDAKEPRRIIEATEEGARAAWNIQ